MLVLVFTAVAHAADVRVYVRFAPGQKAAAHAALAQARGQVHHDFDHLGALVVSLPEAARDALQRNPAVTLIEDDPARGFLAQTVPYGITLVQAPTAVANGATGAGVKIGVVDSGVFAGHEDFQGVAITGEPDFGSGDQRTWYRDVLSHGTHVVGTIAAANNSLGVVGVSPGQVSIHMVKVFGDTGNWIYSSDLLAAATAAAAKGVKIISMSLGGPTPSGIENQGLANLYNNGVLLIAAAGNDGTTKTSYPAGYASVVSVAAVDASKALASFSQRNNDVELAAPGVGVLSTVSYIDTTSVKVGGSTFAAQHVEFAARGAASATLVYGGLGTATNGAWSGKVVLLDRGSNTFYEKVHNVQLSGAVACIIANNEAGALNATLGDGNTSTIPAVGVTQSDGTALKGMVGSTATVSTFVEDNVSGYDLFDGTSMATPHVSGVAALIWSKYPSATNAQVRQALTSSAEDLGSPGRDSSFGYGLVRANAALTSLAALVGGGGGTGDITPPVISALAATQGKGKSGSFDITWTTNEPATSDVTLNGTSYPDPTLTTNHKRTFKGSKGLSYTYVVSSTDAAGNTSSSGPATITLQ